MSIPEQLYFKSPVWAQNFLVSLYGYHLYRKRYTGIYHELLEKVRESRAWNSREIIAYQSERLNSIIKFSRQNIPYYKKLFSDYGFTEQNFTSLEDLKKLPILEKSTLRSEQSDFRNPLSHPYSVQKTSGSTGTPLTIWTNEETYKLAMALLVDFEQQNGVKFGAKRATFAGRMIQPSAEMRPPFSRFNRAENQRLFSSYHLNDATFKYYVEELQNFNPDELIGYPSAIADLAFHFQKRGQKPLFFPKLIVTNSETLLDWQRSVIESTFNCKVMDYYGSAEYLIFASQDTSGHYRVDPLLGVTELLQNQSGQYQVIGTSLTNTDMPLIRYSIGDTAIPLNPNPTDGSVTTIKNFSGRLDDYIVTPDGRRLGRMDHIFKGVGGIREAQVIQVDTSRCLLKIVKDTASPQFSASQIIDNFRSRVGEDMALDFVYVDSISKGPNGKFKGVIGLEWNH